MKDYKGCQVKILKKLRYIRLFNWIHSYLLYMFVFFYLL